MAEVCQLLGIDKSRTTPYHPQSDGLVERYNRTLLSMLGTAASDNPFHWEDHLRPLCMAYNTSINPTTGYSPFFLMFGRQARMPIDVIYGSPNTEPSSSLEHVANLRRRLKVAYEKVRERMGDKLDRQKDFYNRRVHGNPFNEGDWVWLHSVVIPRGQAKKFHRPWTGPFKIVRRIGDATYRIQDLRNRRRRVVVHFDRLKVCPRDMRLPQLPSCNTPAPSQISTPAPPGTGVTLVPPADPPIERGAPPPLPPPPPPPPRYPRREHRLPNYLLHEFIT